MPEPPRPALPPRVLSTADAARYLGVCAGTFRKHVAPQLRQVRAGARVGYDRQQLDAWIEGGPPAVAAMTRPDANPWPVA